MLWPIPTIGCGMSSCFWLIRFIKSLAWSVQVANAESVLNGLARQVKLTVIAEHLFIDNARLALVPDVGNPN